MRFEIESNSFAFFLLSSRKPNSYEKDSGNVYKVDGIDNSLKSGTIKSFHGKAQKFSFERMKKFFGERQKTIKKFAFFGMNINFHFAYSTRTFV